MTLGVAAVVTATLSACGEPENDRTPAAEPGADAAETAVVVYARAADGSPLITRDEDPAPSCPHCRIRLDLLKVFGSHADAVLLRRFPLLVRDSRGFTYAVPHSLYAGLDETVWAVEGANYRLEQLDLSGTLLRVIAVRDRYTSAFLTRAELDSVRATSQRIRPLHELYREMPDHLPHPPIPEIGGVAEHADGRVVVAMRRAAEGWNAVPVVWNAPDPEHISPGEENKQRVYATQLDVIDIASGRLWARTTVPGYGALLNDGSFARMGYGDDGVIRIEVFRLTMHAP